VPSFIIKGIAQATIDRRLGGTLIYKVVLHIRLVVDIAHGKLTIFIDKGGQTFVVESLEVHGEQRTVRVSLHREAVAGHELIHGRLGIKVGHLGLIVREDEVCGPTEILGHDVFGGDRQLFTVRLHACHVGILRNRATDTCCLLGADKVKVVSCPQVERHIDTVIEESGIETDVELVLLLIGKVGICKIRDFQSRLLIGSERTPRVRAFDDHLRIGHRRFVAGE